MTTSRRHRADTEPSVRASEAEGSPLALLTVDAKLDVLEANRTVAELFERTLVDVIGRPLSELMTPDDPQIIARHVAACLQEQRVVTTEIECRTARGERRVIEVSSAPRGRGPDAVAESVCRDIGARREVEASARLLADLTVGLLGVLDPLELGQRLARTLVPQLAEACLVYGRGAGDSLDAAEVEIAAGPLPCLAAEHALGDAHAPWTDAGVARDLAAAATEVARTATPRRLALGACEGHVAPLGAPGKPFGAIVLLRASADRSELGPWRAVAEEVVRRASLAFAAAQQYLDRRRAVEARNDLIAMLSHDLRNGLGTVSMNCQLLMRRRATDEAGELLYRRLEAMKRAADWMTELAEDLLDQRALELGALVIERPPTQAAPLCRESLALHESLATEVEVRLVLEDASEGAIVLADRCRMLQVLDNLLANALQASAPQGEVVLRVTAEPERVRFSVRDSGRGIVLPEGGAAALFAGVGRGSSSPGGRGRGLGLPIARTLVHAMGGEIGVARLPDAGTDFYFTLPRAPATSG